MRSNHDRSSMKAICVYCGSSPGRTEVYKQAAGKVAEELLKRDLTLVYGGASVGVMGVLADSMLALGGKVIGVMPESLLRKEIGHRGLSELLVVSSMHERKTKMADLADGFIAMPGGAGTLEEIFEVWTWAQLGYHNKPCGLLNVAGYFDDLIRFMDHTVKEQFLRVAHRSMFIAEENASILLDRFSEYEPPTVEKWIR